MGNSQNKNAKKSSYNTSVISTNTLAQQCSTIIQPPNLSVKSNVPVQSSNRPIQSFNSPIHSSNTAVQSYNASIISSIKPPELFKTEEEFLQKWLLWKNDFLIYRRIINDGKPNNIMCGDRLLNTMGPIGQAIFKRFTFDSLYDRNNLNILLNKFDEYHTIASIRRLNEEDTFMYIHHLQLKIERANIANAEELIRNKILKEIDEHMFTNAAKRVLSTFKFSSDFNNLTLKEVAFIWKLYGCTQFCDRCGSNHSSDNCPAMGKQCIKCNELNHSHRRCPLIFIHNCIYCGSSHLKKKCPAYDEICTKCKKQNHFSWKCLSTQNANSALQPNQILHCKFCGLTHAASRSQCPAKDTFCTRCKTRGHFASKCKENSYSRKH
nr:PREDICTED: uncharacterized protein LOC100883830 [Megachile rotundata]XP_012153458.1 PREDICTED: uncharacterized protein LOC100883830 [Megachile rotundata]